MGRRKGLGVVGGGREEGGVGRVKKGKELDTHQFPVLETDLRLWMYGCVCVSHFKPEPLGSSSWWHSYDINMFERSILL